jgi:hypothetical protein
MLNVMEVLRGVLVLGRVAAAHVSALKTQTQVDPRVAHFYAFFAYVRVSFRELDLIEM